MADGRGFLLEKYCVTHGELFENIFNILSNHAEVPHVIQYYYGKKDTKKLFTKAYKRY